MTALAPTLEAFFYERLITHGYLSTGRKHDQNPYTLLHQLFTTGAWTPPPDPAPT